MLLLTALGVRTKKSSKNLSITTKSFDLYESYLLNGWRMVWQVLQISIFFFKFSIFHTHFQLQIDIAYVPSRGLHTEVLKIWDIVSHDNVEPLIQV